MRKTGCTCPTNASLERLASYERRLRRAYTWGKLPKAYYYKQLDKIFEIKDELHLKFLLCPAHHRDVRMRALHMLRVD
jgi:hypothetical protein